MRSFSLRGMATKGFWGPNAQTIGAPHGSGQGNSSGPPTPVGPVSPWTVASSGLFPVGVSLLKVVILSGTQILALASDSSVARSTDGGVTWTRIVTIPGNTSGPTPATNGAGVVLFINNFATDIIRSADNGLTWAAVPITPAGTPGIASYFNAAGLFFFISDGTTEVQTSPDGAVWTVHNTVDPTWQGTVPGNTPRTCEAQNATTFVIAGSSAGAVGQVLVSTDGITWAVGTPVVAGLTQFQSIVSDGAQFIALGNDAAANAWTLSVPIANVNIPADWTQNGTTATPNTDPPWLNPVAVYSSTFAKIVAGFDSTFQQVANTGDRGVTWSANVVIPGTGQPVDLYADAARVYAFDVGIWETTDGLTYTTALDLSVSGDTVNDIQTAFGLTIAVGFDAAGNGLIWKRT